MNKLGTRALALAGGLALGTLGVACGDDSGDSESSADDTTTTTEAAVETTITETTTGDDDGGGSADPDAETTEPGASLSLGDAAVVPVEHTGETGTVEMSVTGIEQGDVADLSDFDLDESAQDMVPFYVSYSFTKVSGGALEGVGPEADAAGLLDDGSPAQELALVGQFDACDSEYAPAEFDDGQSYESCRVYMAPQGSTVTGVGFTGGYDGPYYENPVIWEQ